MFQTRKYSLQTQFAISLVIVLAVSGVCYSMSNIIGYRVVALVLLMTVSIIAMLFDILPVLVSAVSSAVIWNFFFIPPLYTFHVDNTEDLLMFLLYFLIALVHAVLTFNIREAEKKARDKEEKETAIKLYNTLLNSLSHELRTPISTIIGATDTLTENRDKLSNEQQKELLYAIDAAGMRLNRQVENLLNMSRLESGMLKPKYDWCDINDLIRSVIKKTVPGETHLVNFHPNDNLPLFRLDSGLVEQILQNLILNAIQYTPPQSYIDIQSDYKENACVISVSDSGPGFPENEIPHAFDKFYRLPHTKAGGSGLGLSIVKGFAEACGGTVHLENNPAGGARFTVTIPVDVSYINSLKNE